MQNTYAHPKLVSVPTLMVLLIAGITGFILVSPVPAHAAGPTITLSATSGTPATDLTISGTGFANAKTITIKTVVGTTTIDWFATAGSGEANSLVADFSTFNACPVSTCLVASAQGDFMTVVEIPEMPGGAQTVTISDGTSTATATFTVTPSVTLETTVSGDTDTFASGYPEQTTAGVTVTVHGFGATESVTTSTSGVFSAFNPTLTTDAFGHATSTVPVTVADTSGGTKSVVFTGGTSSLTGSTTFMVKPWVSFYNTQAGGTTFSFLGKAPTSLLIEGHGFTAGTNIIAGNSITVGGVATTHSSITVGSNGIFGALQGSHIVLSPNTDVPFGQVSVVVQGNTFNLVNANINQWNGAGPQGPVLGGILVSSIVGNAGTTAVGQLDKASYGYADTPNAFGYGFIPGNTIATNANSALVGVTFGTAANTIQNNIVDVNGAIFVSTISGTLGDVAAGSYTDTFTGSGTANTISPSFSSKPVLTLNGWDTAALDGTQVIDFTFSELTFTAHGFSGTTGTTVTVTAGGKTLGTATTGTNGATPITASITPDFAQGTFTATASDGTNTATDTFQVGPQVSPSGNGNTLTVSSGAAGTVTLARTGTDFGVHGLNPNTVYTLNWGMPETSGVNTIGTFTSTATGGIPIPGVQVVIPAGSAGIHIIAILGPNGTDALFNNINEGDTEGFALDVSSQYGDLVFSEAITAFAIPTVVNVGQTFTLTGSGLFGSTTYFTSITTNGDPDGDGATGQLFSQFTTDAAGNIPASTNLAFPTLPANATFCGTSTKFPEKATTYYVHLSQGTEFPGGQDGQALIILSGNAALNMSSVPAGHAVTLTGMGLCPSQAYNVIFNYQVSSSGTFFTGQTVSAFLTNTVGSGTDVFTVPAGTAPGSYTIQLQRLSPTTDLGVLNVPVVLTVGSGGPSGTCNTTSCFTLSGTPTKATLGSLTGLQATFTNSANSSVTGIVYAVVHNSIGQTVYYTTATVTPSAGGTATAFLVLSGLPAGTYSVQVFATDTSGNAISVSTTTSVTLP